MRWQKVGLNRGDCRILCEVGKAKWKSWLSTLPTDDSPAWAERKVIMPVTESWLAVQWWGWESGAMALRGSAGAAYYNPLDRDAKNRWVRRVRYHLHITGTRSNGTAIVDTGRRLLHEIIDLPPNLEPASTAIPPQFSIVTDDSAAIQENLDDRYYCLPRVQRVITTMQSSTEPSAGKPTSGAPGNLGMMLWKAVITLPASAVAEIMKMDRVFVKGGPPISD